MLTLDFCIYVATDNESLPAAQKRLRPNSGAIIDFVIAGVDPGREIRTSPNWRIVRTDMDPSEAQMYCAHEAVTADDIAQRRPPRRSAYLASVPALNFSAPRAYPDKTVSLSAFRSAIARLAAEASS